MPNSRNSSTAPPTTPMRTVSPPIQCDAMMPKKNTAAIDNSVSAIYDRHTYDVEARGWLQKWADHMDRLLIPKVIPITAARAA